MNNDRQFFIDWLRIFAVILLVPFHTAMIFVIWKFHIKNDVLSGGLTLLNYFITAFHMPLLFFLSGAGTWFALRARSGKSYIRERFRRLFIPLIFGILVIVPPQVYIERLHRKHFSGSFFDFYPHVFNGVYPQGNLSWHHLWFLAYLLVFSIVMLPVIKHVNNKSAVVLQRIIRSLSGKYNIFLAGIPLFIIEFSLRVFFPQGNQNLFADWSNFFFYIVIFGYGYYFCTDAKLQDAFVRNRRTALISGIIIEGGTAVAIFYLNEGSGNPVIFSLLYFGLRGLNTWCLIIAIMGYGREFLNIDNRFLKYAREASLPFYILHQTCIIVIGYYVIGINAGVALKFTIIMFSSFAVTLLIYDLAVKRIKVLRFFFGMKTNV